MNNYNDFAATYQPTTQPNLYYQPTQTAPIYSPKSWQQYYQQPVVPNINYQQQQVQPMNNPMVWVQGEAGAKAYALPNNTTLPLWDSESQTIYIKTVDQNGKPTMTILDYVDRNAVNSNDTAVGTVQVEYATKEQIESLGKQFSDISKKFDAMNQYVTSDQFQDMSNHINDLGDQIKDIEDRITSFGKSQSSNYNNNKRGSK